MNSSSALGVFFAVHLNNGPLFGRMSVMTNEPNGKENPVKAVRLALGLTQEEMAQRLGCSSMTARRCEYEERVPTTRAVLANLAALAKEAGIAFASLPDVGAVSAEAPK
jgi:DNA-binding XRE family transcriptional regulator